MSRKPVALSRASILSSKKGPNVIHSDEYDRFDSRDTTVIMIDSPCDHTVRPCPPHLLPILTAIKEKWERDVAEFGLPAEDTTNVFMDEIAPPTLPN